MGISRLAVIAVSTTAIAIGFAASADASTAPQFGRCVKLAKAEGPGEYIDHNCTKQNGQPSRFNWVAGPGPKAGFAGAAPATIAEAGGGPTTISCAQASVAGEYSGLTSESLGITLTGCQLASSACQSEGAAAGEVVTQPLEGELVIVKRETNPLHHLAGIVWRPALGDTFASFQCGATSVALTGSVMYEKEANKMQSSEKAKIRVNKKSGGNVPSCWEPCSSHPVLLRASFDEAAPVIVGLSMPMTINNQEAIAASTVF